MAVQHLVPDSLWRIVIAAPESAYLSGTDPQIGEWLWLIPEWKHACCWQVCFSCSVSPPVHQVPWRDLLRPWSERILEDPNYPACSAGILRILGYRAVIPD